jgi:uncharacterized cupin superfamily protein
VNVHSDDWTHEGVGRFDWRHKRAGGELLGASVYELAPGRKNAPYHYHRGIEEWLLVVRGRPTLRTPDGERELREGDLVRFPEGPDGAHRVLNRTDEPVRVLIVSNLAAPTISYYPDSDKVGVRPSATPRDPEALNFPRSAAVDYWEGED